MPDPLHIPPIVTVLPPAVNTAAASFSCVSVVIIARAAAFPASFVSESPSAKTSTPLQIFSIGSCMPITPVDATKTASSGIFKTSAVFFAVRLQYASPSSPVHAFAIPELTTTACANSLFDTIFLSHLTGAACTTFVVNVPAATHGTVL